MTTDTKQGDMEQACRVTDLERLARAINPNAWVDSPYFMSDSRKWHRRESLAAVRTMLTELLNLSERMLEAGIHAEHDKTMGGRFSAGFTAAIRHILTEGEDKG